MAKLDYKNDIKIDVDALDVEAAKHSEITWEYREEAAKAQRREDKAKEKLEYTEAKVDEDVRNNPEKHGVEKITDNTVKMAVRRSDEYRQAYKEWVEARHKRQVTRGAVDSMNDKKETMGYLISLWKGQYFAGPAEPRNIVERFAEDEQERQQNSRMSQKLNKRQKGGTTNE